MHNRKRLMQDRRCIRRHRCVASAPQRGLAEALTRFNRLLEGGGVHGECGQMQNGPPPTSLLTSHPACRAFWDARGGYEVAPYDERSARLPPTESMTGEIRR